MPPCRSSPRLMVFFGGYSAQIDAISTTSTITARVLRFLCILLALGLHHPTDRSALELQLHLVPDAQSHRCVRQVRHRSIHPARRHHAIAPLDGAEHPLPLLLLALLRPDHQEVE